MSDSPELCYICSSKDPEVPIESSTAKSSNRTYSNLILERMPKVESLQSSEDFLSEGLLCIQCVTLLDELEFMMNESRLLSEIIQKLLIKKYSMDEPKADTEDRKVSELFVANFLCRKCDFSTTTSEVLCAHWKFHEILDRERNGGHFKEEEVEPEAEQDDENEYLVEVLEEEAELVFEGVESEVSETSKR